MKIEDDQSWKQYAACAARNDDRFFPSEHGRSPSDKEEAQEAKKQCYLCGVRAQCLAWAVRNDIGSGIWGGYTSRERRAILREVQRAKRLASISSAAVETPDTTAEAMRGVSSPPMT